MFQGKALESKDLEFVAELLNAIFTVRHQLGPISDEALRELAHALPKAEEVLRACAKTID